MFKYSMLVFFQVYPVIYALMSHRTASSYDALFEFIESFVFELEPVSFMCDFEYGLRKSLHTKYPNSRISGSWFHFDQAVRRKCCSLKKKFHRQISQHREKVRIYRKLLLLPLLPQRMIHDAFVDLRMDAEVFDCATFFKTIFEYYETEWIEKNVSENAEL